MNKVTVTLLVVMCASVTYCTFTYQKSHAFTLGQSVSINSFALAPKDISSSAFGVTINTAFGLNNGTVIFSNTQDFQNTHTFNACNNSIQKLQWNQASLIIVCEHEIKAYDPTSLQTKFNLTRPQSSIQYTAHAVKNAGLMSPSVMTAMCINNEISLYENSRFIKSLKTKITCRSMAFDNKGKYFYYFDNHLRVIYNVQTQQVYESYQVSSNYIAVAAASKTNNEDITVSLDTDGYLYVWDDQNLLNSYSIASQIQLKFNQNSDYLITLKSNNSLYIYRTSFTNFTSWSKIQQITLSTHNTLTAPGLIAGFEAKQNKIAYVLNNQVYLYVYEQSSGGDGNVFVGIFVSVVFCCCVGIICSNVMKRNRGYRYRVNCWALICCCWGNRQQQFIIRQPIVNSNDSYSPIGSSNNCTECRDPNCRSCVPPRNYNHAVNQSINSQPAYQPNHYNRPPGNYPGPNQNPNNREYPNQSPVQQPFNNQVGPYNGYHNQGGYTNNNMNNNYGPQPNNMGFNNNKNNEGIMYNPNSGQYQNQQNANYVPAPYNGRTDQNQGIPIKQQPVYQGQPLSANPYGRSSQNQEQAPPPSQNPPKQNNAPQYRPPNP